MAEQRSLPPSPLLPYRVRGWCGYVPFSLSLSLAHSAEGLSSHCISFSHAPKPQRNHNYPLTTLLPLFQPSRSSSPCFPSFPHLGCCFSLLCFLLSLISIQSLKIKMELWKANLFLFFFSWRWVLKIHAYMCRHKTTFKSSMPGNASSFSGKKKVLIIKVNAKNRPVSQQNDHTTTHVACS